MSKIWLFIRIGAIQPNRLVLNFYVRMSIAVRSGCGTSSSTNVAALLHPLIFYNYCTLPQQKILTGRLRGINIVKHFCSTRLRSEILLPLLDFMPRVNPSIWLWTRNYHVLSGFSQTRCLIQVFLNTAFDMKWIPAALKVCVALQDSR